MRYLLFAALCTVSGASTSVVKLAVDEEPGVGEFTAETAPEEHPVSPYIQDWRLNISTVTTVQRELGASTMHNLTGAGFTMVCQSRIPCACSDLKCGHCPAHVPCVKLGENQGCCCANPSNFNCNEFGVKIREGNKTLKTCARVCCSKGTPDEPREVPCGGGADTICCPPSSHGRNMRCGHWCKAPKGQAGGDLAVCTQTNCCVPQDSSQEAQTGKQCCRNKVGYNCLSRRHRKGATLCCLKHSYNGGYYHHTDDYCQPPGPIKKCNRSDIDCACRNYHTPTATMTVPVQEQHDGDERKGEYVGISFGIFGALVCIVIMFALFAAEYGRLSYTGHRLRIGKNAVAEGRRQQAFEIAYFVLDEQDEMFVKVTEEHAVRSLPGSVALGIYESAVKVATGYAITGLEGTAHGGLIILGDVGNILPCGQANDILSPQPRLQEEDVRRKHLPQDGAVIADGNSAKVHCSAFLVNLSASSRQSFSRVPMLMGRGARTAAAASACLALAERKTPRHPSATSADTGDGSQGGPCKSRTEGGQPQHGTAADTDGSSKADSREQHSGEVTAGKLGKLTAADQMYVKSGPVGEDMVKGEQAVAAVQQATEVTGAACTPPHRSQKGCVSIMISQDTKVFVMISGGGPPSSGPTCNSGSTLSSPPNSGTASSGEDAAASAASFPSLPLSDPSHAIQ
eukprot:TRINITY_DN4560_c0_g1_i6.p1 TRINITY_DN4560_c0_g1~~TRINITY_DN4560_c0_g1_i6.p1  ORF type:complete len:708 (+),score=96.71 TRINITY_DN4560_c0_g1_i6:76-2124(+)